PMNDRDFIAQMAQFSTLEQMTKLSTAMTSFIEMQMSGTLAQHSYLIGQQVYWSKENDDGEAVSGEGVVQSVSFKDGKIFVELDNKQKIEVTDIYRKEA